MCGCCCLLVLVLGLSAGRNSGEVFSPALLAFAGGATTGGRARGLALLIFDLASAGEWLRWTR